MTSIIEADRPTPPRPTSWAEIIAFGLMILMILFVFLLPFCNGRVFMNLLRILPFLLFCFFICICCGICGRPTTTTTTTTATNNGSDVQLQRDTAATAAHTNEVQLQRDTAATAAHTNQRERCLLRTALLHRRLERIVFLLLQTEENTADENDNQNDNQNDNDDNRDDDESFLRNLVSVRDNHLHKQRVCCWTTTTTTTTIETTQPRHHCRVLVFSQPLEISVDLERLQVLTDVTAANCDAVTVGRGVLTVPQLGEDDHHRSFRSTNCFNRESSTADIEDIPHTDEHTIVRESLEYSCRHTVVTVDTQDCKSHQQLQSLYPNNNERETMVCAICLMDYKVGDILAWSFNEKCDHAYHADCIKDWLLPPRPSTTCPCCRQDYII